MRSPAALVAALFVLLASASAHSVAWAKGMYCKNGLNDFDDPTASFPADPIWNMSYHDWFMHGECINYPPPEGEFLEIPAGGKFTAELSPNRAFTSLSFNGSKITGWGDGQDHPADYSTTNLGGFNLSENGCISSPNLHAHNVSDAAGSVFAIVYTSNMAEVNMDNLVVFSVAPNTPYSLIGEYEVPEDMPGCPPGGCICAWGWVPNHCGQSNEYMTGYRCQVTNVKSTARPIAKPRAPVWCENEPGNCVQGAKKMVIAFQAEGNTVTLPPAPFKQADGDWLSPGYNHKMGFEAGAQNDIFVMGNSASRGSASAGLVGAALAFALFVLAC